MEKLPIFGIFFIAIVFLLFKREFQSNRLARNVREAPTATEDETLMTRALTAKVVEVNKTNYNNYNHVYNRIGNHTLMKANIDEVRQILKNIKSVDIDPRQINIFKKYQRQNGRMIVDPESHLKTFNDKISVSERDRMLRERKNVVHPHPFKYIINSPNICSDDSPFLLVYVHTSPGNRLRREVIRRTWGNMRQYEDVVVKIVFFLGVANESNPVKMNKLNDMLSLEQELYGDLVQEDFLDTYRNLTYKGVAALKWISLYCPQPTFILKTDDDIFVNMYSLLGHFKHLEKDENNLRGVIMCAVWYGMVVQRHGKWSVSKEEWSGDDYPTYCSGSAFILTPDVAMILHEVSYHVPFFWVDDFYITGLLPLKAGNIIHRPLGPVYVLNGDLLEEQFTGPQWFTYLFSHLKEMNRIINVWNKIKRMHNRELFPVIEKTLPGQLKV